MFVYIDCCCIEFNFVCISKVGFGVMVIYVGKCSGYSIDNGFNLFEYMLLNLNVYYVLID